MIMDISARYIHNDMIKQSENGGLESVVDYITHKVMISDTILRLFIPPQFRKMTAKLRQICGCEICIIPNDMKLNLNIFRKILVIDLQQKYVGRHTCNSLFITTSVEYYKDKVFPDGECLHATIKNAAQFITCLTIKPNNIINIKCDLVFFMNGLSEIFQMKNYMIDQMLQ